MLVGARLSFCFWSSRIFRSLPKWVIAAVLVTAGIASGRSQQPVQVLHKHVRPEVANGTAQYVGPMTPESRINFSLVLTLRNQDQLTSLLGRLYDPTSPDYHHFLSVSDFTERFAPTAADYQTVLAFAESNGFTVTSTPANRLVVPVTGTVAQINRAFHVTMGQYQHPTENRTFYSPDREPSLTLSVPIAHISGLNNFSLPRPHVTQPQETTAQPLVTNGSGPGGSYLASDMRTAYYGTGTLNGTGQAVGLVEFDGYNISDVNLTFSSVGQSSSVPINNVLLDGATGAPYGSTDTAEAEVVLDIVQAIGMAPGLSQVRVYIGTGEDDANILNSMASENIAKQLSCSWGWRPEDAATDDIFFEEFAAQGQSFFTASGDAGAFDSAISPFFYPAEDAYVTAVGGTHLSTSATDGSWLSETAWNSDDAGSGGGVSPDGIAIPSWQTSSINASNAGSTTLRNVPDVAMEGDFDNYLCTLGSCYPDFAGTSFAAPRWAGFAALVNQQAVENGTAPTGGVGFLNPSLYQISTGSNYSGDFHDVTVGDNDTENQPVWYSAVSGYDLVTGLGSASGQNLINDLAGPQVPGFWIYSSTGTISVNQGASATTTFTVADAGGFSGDVTLAITSPLPSGVTASWGTNPTSGSSVLTVTASSTAAAGTVNLTIVGTSGNLTATTNVKLAVRTPTFLLTPSPSSVGVAQAGTGSSTVLITPEYGFTGNVNLSVSGLPAGVTASWSANPASGSSTLTLSASSTAIEGPANLTITGTSGDLTVTTNLTVTVYAPTFSIDVASAINMGQGTTYSTYTYVIPEYGFSGVVNLSISGLPSGVTASFSPNPTSGYAALTITASNSTAIGQYPLTITGTSGSVTESATLTLGIYAPTFSLSTSSPVNIGQGTSTTGAVLVTGEYGFASNVNLSISSLPSGVTASITPNPTTYSTTITFTATGSAAVGQYPLTITGTSGSLTKTATLTLGVYTPTFGLAGPSSVTLGQGASTTSSVTVQPLYGFTGSVNLSVSGLPSGVTASFLPNPTTGNSALSLSAGSSTALGQYTVTVKGTYGSQTATTTFTLTIAAPGFTLSDSYPLSLGQGASTTSSVFVTGQNGFNSSVNLSASGLPSGVTASFSPNPTTSSNSSVLTSTASSSAPAGQYTFNITGTSGSLTATTTAFLTIGSPGFSLSGPTAISVGQGSSSPNNYFNISPTYGFNGYVSLSVSGLPAGVTASFATNPTSNVSYLTVSASSSAAAGQYRVTVTGTSGSLTASTTFTLTVGTPSFSLSGLSTLTIGQGAVGNGQFSVVAQNGFNGNVNMSVSGLPAGVTASFSPNPTTYSSTLTLTAASSAAVGQYSVTILGASGGQTATATLTLSIVAPTFTLSVPATVTLGQGTSSNTPLSVSSQNGFGGSVNLAVSGLPSGVTTSFSPNPATGASTLTLSAGASVALGQYPLTVTGTSGTQTVTATTTLTIYTPAFTLSSSGISVGRGNSATTSVAISSLYGFTGAVNLSASGLPSGVTASFSPNPATGTSTLTLSASNSASLGQYPVTITGTSGTQTATTSIVVSVYTPTFTLSGPYNVINVGQGGSATGSIAVNPEYGFAGYVNLSVSGLPSGVTATFSSNPVVSGSTMTLTASSTAVLGQYTVMVTGTSGDQTVTTPVTVGVYTPAFTVTSYSNISMGQGTSSTAYVYVQGQYNFSGAVNLSISGLPSGVTASFSPNPTSSSSTLTLSANISAPVGQYTLTITGTYGTQTATTPISLTINAPAFTLAGVSSLTIGQGASTNMSIIIGSQYGFSGSVSLSVAGLPNGVTASFSPNPATGSSVLTLTANSSAALGQYPLTITGTSGSRTATLNTTLGVYVPAFALSGPSSFTLGQGSSISGYLDVSLSYGFTGSVNFSITGLPSGVTATFSPNPTTYSTLLTLAATSAVPLGQYSLTITGTSGAQAVTLSVPLVIAAPSFTLYGPNTVELGQGESATAYAIVQSANGFNSSVTFSISGLPDGVTASFSPNPTTSETVLTLTASSSATLGEYNATITGTSGSVTATLPLSVQIHQPAFSLSSTYNVTINQGGSGTSAVYIGGEYGFNSPVTLSASNLPSGVTASFSPNPATSTSTVTFTASAGAVAEPAIVTILGTSGSLTASTTLNLTVNASAFSIADAPSETILFPGASSKSVVSVIPLNGFSGTVNLAIAGLPAGVTGTFSSPSTATSSTLTLTASSSATAGTTVATITGASGTESATEPLQITVRTASPATTTLLTISAAGSPVTSVASGTPVTLTATVTSGSTPLTVGQVVFCKATATYCGPGSMVGIAQLTSAGAATLTLVPGMGNHSYKAIFLGTNAAGSSSSAASSLSVASALATSTVIAQSGSAGAYSLTATVSSHGAIPPDGTVSFLDTSNANNVLGSATLTPTQATFSSTVSQVPITGSEPTSLAVGDFNGDGIPDFAVVNAVSPGGVTIFLGNGDGAFTAGTPLTTSGIQSAIVAADLNGDGKLDIVVGNQNPNSLSIFLGNGDGTFASSAFNPQMSATPGSIAAGDLNGDGIPDLAIVGQSGSTVNVLLGNGDGTFTAAASSSETGGSSRSVQIGDFNGDGVPDLVVANQSNSSLTVLLGNGDGTFAPAASSPATGSNPLSVAIGDFNGDGIQDLAVANGSSNSITVLLGNGDGTFTPSSSSPSTGSDPNSLAIGDFNNDGIQDLAVANYYASSATIFLGKGDGTFASASTLTTASYPFNIAVGDFNGDGIPDLISASYSADATVMLSKLTQTATATAGNISPVGTGSHNVDASYPGSTYFQSSTSSATQLTGQTVAPAVTLTPSPSGATIAQALAVTVSVSGGTGNPIPTGSIVLAGGSYTSAAVALSNGGATITIPPGSLAVGTNVLTATYTPDTGGSADYTIATGYGSVPIGKATPIVTITPSSSSITTVQTLNVVVGVSGGTGAPAATGSVVLSSGSYTSGATQLATGAASINVPAGILPVGSDSLTVSYTPDTGGSAIYNTASGSSSVTIAKAAPTVIVTPASPSVTNLQSLSVTFTVSGGAGSPAPTGTVVLTSGTSYTSAPTPVGTPILIPAGALPMGTDSLTLTYTPDSAAAAIYAAATGTSSVVVGVTMPSVTLIPSSSSISTVQGVTVAITIKGGTGATAPTGSVTLTSGSYTSPAVALSNGAASIAIPAGALAAGSDILFATYTPDASSSAAYAGATGTTAVTVNKTTPSVSINSSISTITTAQGLSVTVALSGGAGNPSPFGSVVLTSGTYTSSATPLSSASATIAIPAGSLAAGADTLSVSYAPDSASAPIYHSATGSSSVVVIGTASAAITAAPSAAIITNEQTLTVAVSVSGAAGQATGAVTLTTGAYNAQQTLSNGAASFSIPPGTLTPGANTLTVSYSGNNAYNIASVTSSVTVAPVVASASAPAAVIPGTTATSTLTLTAGSNYSGTMNLSCTLITSPQGAQDLPACVFATAAMQLSAGGSGTDSITIKTTPASSARMTPAFPPDQRSASYGIAMAFLLIFGFPSRRRLSRWMLLVLCAGLSAAVIGCGGGSSTAGGSSGTGGSQNPGTTAGVYVFTLTGTDASNSGTTASTTLTVTVQ